MPSRPSHLSSLRFGVATADHQCEAYDAHVEDIRDVWERRQALTPRGRATDFWNRYAEDIELARGLGCKLFRFSVAWSRVEPTPGVFDADALAHYADLARAVVAAGMEPILSLHHFTWPIHIEARGGLRAKAFPTWFSDYTEQVVAALGAHVRTWITFNEPTLVIFGWVKPWWEGEYFLPPGLPEGATVSDQMTAVAQVIRNLFLGHTQARTIIKAAHPDAQVGANPLLLGLPAWLQKLVDRNATGLRTEAEFVQQGGRLVDRAGQETGQVDVVMTGLTSSQVSSDAATLSQPYLVLSAESSVLRPQPSTLSRHSVLSTQYSTLRTQPYLAAAVAPGSREFVDVVDLSIQRFWTQRVGELGTLAALGAVPPPPMTRSLADINGLNSALNPLADGPLPLAAPGTTLRHIQNRGYLVVGVRDNAPGLSARNPATGKLVGLEIDLGRAIAQTIFGDPSRVAFKIVTDGLGVDWVRSVQRWLEPLQRGYSTLATALTSNWWHLGMSGQLAEFLCPRECVGQQDFVGFDYYWGISTLRLDRARRLLSAVAGRFGEAPVWPEALYDMLRYHAAMFPNLPILIIENGCVDMADGLDRANYLRQHNQRVQRAIGDGVNVTGYVCWSITSNREWGLPFDANSDFGLYHIDLDADPALTRLPTPAAKAYRDIINNG